MQPLDLIRAAERQIAPRRGAQSQASLRRAVSTVYYALFHCLARSGADLFIGSSAAARAQHAWRQVYRGLDHATARAACREPLADLFCQPVQDFALEFVFQQQQRHAADYDPLFRTTQSKAMGDVARARAVIEGFQRCPVAQRRAFAALVPFRRRPG
jgi:hypothetical protein